MSKPFPSSAFFFYSHIDVCIFWSCQLPELDLDHCNVSSHQIQVSFPPTATCRDNFTLTADWPLSSVALRRHQRPACRRHPTSASVRAVAESGMKGPWSSYFTMVNSGSISSTANWLDIHDDVLKACSLEILERSENSVTVQLTVPNSVSLSDCCSVSFIRFCRSTKL